MLTSPVAPRSWYAAFLLLIAGSAWAQDNPYYESSWALLIGINEYQSEGVPDLRFARADVQAMRELLVERYAFPVDHVTCLEDGAATREAILHALAQLSDTSRVTEDDRVLFFFSGHGQTVPAPQGRGGEMGYLLPHDATVDLDDVTNPAQYEATCVGMDELRRRSNLIPAKHVLFLVDACYSGLAAEQTRGPALRRYHPLRTVSRLPVREIITAGLAGEEAHETEALGHGAFTHALLRALGEEPCADINGDGFTTALELASWIRGEVPRTAPQTPRFVSFGGEGEFLFMTARITAFSSPGKAPPPVIRLLEPRELRDGVRDLVVRPLGDTVEIVGVAASESEIVSVKVDDAPVVTGPVTTEARDQARLGDGLRASTFRYRVEIGQGATKTVVIHALNRAGESTTARVQIQARAEDTSPPDLLLVEPALADGEVVLSPDRVEPVRVFGLARDDQAVVALTANGRSAEVRPATYEELAANGWAAGRAFELQLNPQALTDETEITVAAEDAAGNRSESRVKVRRSRNVPDILVTKPERLRGSMLMVPLAEAVMTIQVEGLARSDAGITRVTVNGQPAALSPADAEALRNLNWRPPAKQFRAQVPVANQASTTKLVVEATDAAGATGSTSMLVRTPGRALTVTLTPDKPTYRIGERIHLTIGASSECYAYLFHRAADGSLSTFLPNPVEPDCFLSAHPGARGIAVTEAPGADATAAAAYTRTFPAPDQEQRYPGEYGLAAVEPPGTDTAYCLAVPHPLPAGLLQSVANLEDLGLALEAGARIRDTKLVLPGAITETDIAQAAAKLGGTWTMARYEVVR